MRFEAVRNAASSVRWRRAIIAACVAFCVAFAYYIHLVPRRTLDFSERLGIASYLGAFFFVLVYLVLRFVSSELQAYGRRARILWILASLGAGALLVVVTPLRPPAEPTRHTIEVVATGQKSAQAQGSETWLYGITQGDAPAIPISTFAPDEGWATKDEALLAAGPGPATARWEGILEPGAQLRFLAHPWSGIVEVRIDGASQTVDLYSDSPATRNVPIPPETGTAQPATSARNAALFVADAVSIALLVLVVMLRLVRFSGGGGSAGTPRWSWLAYTIPCLCVWLLYLLALWPGMMSPDSFAQWNQARSGLFFEPHPPAHTMIIWLVMRIWPSPAAMALLQIVTLAVVFGLTMHELGRWGVPLWVRGTITILFCLAPVNGAMTITLWKDVLYSVAMLAVFSLLLRVVRTRGAWLHPWRNRALFAAPLAAVALFRHNGLPLSLFVIAAAFVLLKSHRRSVGTVALLWALAYLAVRVGVYNFVGASPTSYSLYYSAHQMAAFVHSGVALSPQDRALLNNIQPLSLWGANYTCYNGDPTFWSKSFNRASLQSHAAEFTALWLRLIREHPDVFLQHLFCVNSINWRIVPAPSSYMYVLQNGIRPNAFGFEQHALLPQLTAPLQQYLFWFHRTGQGWIWRPALYFYLTLAAVSVAALRRHDAQILLLATVSLGNIGVMMLLTPTQDLRYQYGVVMIGMIAPALLWAASAPRSAASAAAPTLITSTTTLQLSEATMPTRA
jgi:hypothetical protein